MPLRPSRSWLRHLPEPDSALEPARSSFMGQGLAGVTNNGGMTGHGRLAAICSLRSPGRSQNTTPPGSFLGRWRLMSIDGFEWDAPDMAENAAEFGCSGIDPADPGRRALPKAQVVSVSECGSRPWRTRRSAGALPEDLRVTGAVRAMRGEPRAVADVRAGLATGCGGDGRRGDHGAADGRAGCGRRPRVQGSRVPRPGTGSGGSGIGQGSWGPRSRRCWWWRTGTGSPCRPW